MLKAKIFFTKKSNWEILTKNSVTFKRSDAFKDKKLIFLGFTEKSDFKRGGHEKLV